MAIRNSQFAICNSLPSPRWIRCATTAAFLLAFAAQAQITFTAGPAKDVRFPEYYPATSPTQTNRALKTLLSANEARQRSSRLFDLTGLRIASFRPDGRGEFEVSAAGCLYDVGTHEASSPAHLQVRGASGHYAIEGDGFFWRRSDGLLVISNRAVSTFNRAVLAPRSAELRGATEPSVSAAAAPTGQVVRISSDRCLFHSQSNIVTQSGHVVADDAQMQLACEDLSVHLTSEKRPREILARHNVSILNKSDQSRATSGQAVYVISPDQETVTLTENPSWRDRDARQEVNANRFLYDLKAKSIRGEGQATMRLPRGSLSQPWPLLERPASATPPPAAAAGTNFVHLTSDRLTILLAATNRPHRTAVAEDHVVILSPGDDTRASGDKAVYDEAAGSLELRGDARWESEGRVVTADTLSLDRTNRVFTGRGHVRFRVPLSQLGSTGLLPAQTNRAATTNLFLEVLSDDLAYGTNGLTFRGGVRARFLEGESLRGLVSCESLSARFRGSLDSLLAEKHVVAEHYPPRGAKGQAVTNLLSCEVLAAKFSESGQVVALVAAESVQAAQIEVRTNQARAKVTELTCEALTAVLLPKSGQVDKLHAERHVVVTQDDKTARGTNAIYTAADNRIELTGEPFAEFSGGKVADADILIWDRAKGTFRGRGSRYRIEWANPAGRTNRTSFLFPKK